MYKEIPKIIDDHIKETEESKEPKEKNCLQGID